MVFNDEKLSKIFTENFQSIIQYFEPPEIISTIRNMINDERVVTK